MARQVFNVKITLTDAQVGRLSQGFVELNEAAVVQAVSQDIVGKYAEGGLLLPAAVVTRIEKHLDKIEDPVEVAEAIESSNGMDGDNVVVSITLDPIWVGELQQKAEMLGMTLDALASDLASQIMNQGLLYDMETERLPIYLSPEQYAAIHRSLGLADKEPIFGEHIAKKLGWKEPTDAETEEDLFVGGKV